MSPEDPRPRDEDRGSSPARRFESRTSMLDATTTIRRALPNRALRTVGAWCFLDHAGPVRFGPGQGMHVGPHPHIGLQTFTWMIEGEAMHRDSLGNEQVVRSGEVNLMTAGRGIAHSEDSVTDGDRLHLAQLWIALPDAERHRAPDFTHYPDPPVLERAGMRVTVLVGEALGQASPVAVHSPLVGVDVAAGTAARDVLPIAPEFEHAALVLQGEARIAGEALRPGTLLHLGIGRRSLDVECGAQTRFLLLGGEPFGEAPLMWWNFVARTQAEIEEARADWESGSARFGPVAGAPRQRIAAPSLSGVRLKAWP